MSKLNAYLSADQRLYSEYLPNLPHGHFKQEEGYRINLWYSGVKKILILRFYRKVFCNKAWWSVNYKMPVTLGMTSYQSESRVLHT